MSETEKIPINLGLVDLGQIDLLVQEGFYSNRTDFIRTAIRNQLTTHAEEVKQTVARKTLVLGLQHYTRRDLEAAREAGETLEIKVLGLAIIADDVDPELALETIDSVIVLGALRASQAVKSALKDRIQSPYSKEGMTVNDQLHKGIAEAGRLPRWRPALQRVLPPGLKLAVRVCAWSLEPASLPFVLRAVLACEGGAAGEGSEFPCEVLYLGRNDE